MTAPENKHQFIRNIFAEDFGAVRRYIASGGSVNFEDEKGNTPLLVAIETFNTELVELLLSSGADPNKFTDYATPLNAAIDVSVEAYKNEETEVCSTDIIERLLAHGANVMLADKKGRTAYDFAKNYHLPAEKLFNSLNI
ncbi:ankyrin repeat domain-containing protein [Fibrella sp. WM1]|uniref:ankyrin repeat domain-containing protein n=1 Tax=Fibrella musci TaxID=3242485 RepID=UPI003520B892